MSFKKVGKYKCRLKLHTKVSHYWNNLLFDEWIKVEDIPKLFFDKVFEIIDRPDFRPNVYILEDEDFELFKKVKKEAYAPWE